MISPLISVSELMSADIPQLAVFDCRFSLADGSQGRQAYSDGHISGSRYLHLDNDLSAPLGKHGGRHPLPAADQFQQLMRHHGVNDDTLVIAYDDQHFAFASRLWWLLRYFGHSKVRILDGGFSVWQAAGGPVDNHAADKPAAGNFIARPQSDWIVDYHNVCEYLESTGRVLIDSREAARYQGLEEPIDPIAGHIPGAANYPWQEVTNSGGFANSPANLRHRWAGLPTGKELVVYCGSGVTACVNLLSLELAGITGARLYPGSWSDWCSYQ